MTANFWSQPTSEPKRQHRFLLSLPLLTAGGVTVQHNYLAKTVSKPSYAVGEIEHKFLGNTYYYPGAVTWDPVTATLVNSISPDANLLLYEALYRGGYMDPKEQEAYFGGGGLIAIGAAGSPTTPNKSMALGNLGEVTIRELDGGGAVVGSWVLKNAWVQAAKFGDLDYSGEELLNIELTMKYDWAWYGTHNATPGQYEGDLPAFSTGVI